MTDFNALTSVSTESLVEELIKRHDAIIVSGVRFTNVNGEFVTMNRWNGHKFTLLAILSQMMFMVNQELHQIQQYKPGHNQDR